MANVWFVRRVGGRWKAPEGNPVYALPLDQLIFKLDLGWQRWLGSDGKPDPMPEAPTGAPPTKVLVEVAAADLDGEPFPAFKVGWYDSPYSPAEAARRLGPEIRARVEAV